MEKEIITVYIDSYRMNHEVYTSPAESDGIIRIRKAKGYLKQVLYPDDSVATWFYEINKKGNTISAYGPYEYGFTFKEVADNAMEKIHKQHGDNFESVMPVLLDS